MLTIGTADAGLLRLPWELIADEIGPLANRMSVRRQLEQPQGLVTRAAVLPLRLLYIVSRPGDTGFIDPRLTSRSVFDALIRSAPASGSTSAGRPRWAGWRSCCTKLNSPAILTISFTLTATARLSLTSSLARCPLRNRTKDSERRRLSRIR